VGLGAASEVCVDLSVIIGLKGKRHRIDGIGKQREGYFLEGHLLEGAFTAIIRTDGATKISRFGHLLECVTDSLVSPSFRVGLPWYMGYSFRTIMVQLVIPKLTGCHSSVSK
jgi:hypothetical protein